MVLSTPFSKKLFEKSVDKYTRVCYYIVTGWETTGKEKGVKTMTKVYTVWMVGQDGNKRKALETIDAETAEWLMNQIRRGAETWVTERWEE